MCRVRLRGTPCADTAQVGIAEAPHSASPPRVTSAAHIHEPERDAIRNKAGNLSMVTPLYEALLVLKQQDMTRMAVVVRAIATREGMKGGRGTLRDVRGPLGGHSLRRHGSGRYTRSPPLSLPTARTICRPHT